MKMIDRTAIDLIQSELRARGLSRSDLARLMNVHPNVITNYFNGHSKMGLNTIERLFRALDLEPVLTCHRIPADTVSQ